MQRNTIKLSKKIITISAIVATIIWLSGAANIKPAYSNTNVCPALKTGDMIKVNNYPAIYVINNKNEALYFPTGNEFKSWRPNYGGYIGISSACLDSLMVPKINPAGINFAPGSYVVRNEAGSQLYVVEPNNTLAKITHEAAKILHGDKNGKYAIRTVRIFHWPNYVNRGAEISTAKPYPGMLIKINGIFYYVYIDGKLREITPSGFTANNFQAGLARTLDSSLVAGMQYGSKIDNAIAAIIDKTQITTYPADTGSPFLPPTAPTLTGVEKAGGAYLSWTKYDGQNFKYYRIVRSETNTNPVYPSNKASFTSNNQGLTTYTDTKVTKGKTYYYNICVQTTVNSYLCSSAIKIIIPAPNPTPTPPPTTVGLYLTATAKTNGIYLSWTKYTGSGLEYYKVVRSETNSNPKYPADGYLTYSTDVNFTSYTDTSAKPNTNYYYRICVKLISGTITCGNVVTAKYTDTTPTPTPTPTSTPTPTPTYSLSASTSSVNEGSSITFTLTTTNVTNNTNVSYTVSGISSSDLSAGSLSGNFQINSNKATQTFTLSNDATTEGTETMLLSLTNSKASASVTVNDTSLTPAPTPTPTPSPYGTTYYIRTDGGDATQCTGLANVAYPGSGNGLACAWKHPFIAIPPKDSGLAVKIKGGDTLIIANGSYKMGYGAIGAVGCDNNGSYECMMKPIPSGPSADKPTKILGASYNNGCTAKPELYGSGRPWAIIDLNDSSNIEMQCLEITDHSSCIEFHSGGNACNRDNAPYGDWASIGIRSEDSSNVTLKNLDIHGLAHTGVYAGRLTDWTLENVKITANGWVGWDGDVSGSDNNSGTMTFKKVNIDWNGCGETYPGKQPVGCWSQTAGGYGDGFGTGDTGGNWLFEDSTFSHNTSDGLDMLYHRLGGTLTIRRVRAEGNAGNQIKTAGQTDITDSIIISNCGYFQGKSFTHNVDNCRALGSALSLDLRSSSVNLYNNSIYSEGDCLVYADRSGSGKVKALNNIMYAGTDYLQPFEKSCYFYTESGVPFDNDYNISYQAKDNGNYCAAGSHNLCNTDPKFTSVSASNFNLFPLSTSPAIDKGYWGSGITALDFLSKIRPQGSGVDIGAYEVK